MEQATDQHERAGKEFDIIDDNGTVAMYLDRPDLIRLNGVDPIAMLSGWRMTGEMEAKRRGGVMFCGESRSGKTVTRHYRKATRWRRAWFAVVRPRLERMARV